MFNLMLTPIPCPCRECAERCFNCWSSCDRYAAYRGALDRIHHQNQARRAVDEAGVARGDKIRRDVHRYGRFGRRKP